MELETTSARPWAIFVNNGAGVIIYIFDSPGLQEQKFSHDFLHVYGDMSHINVEERTEQRRRKRMLKWREEKAQRSASSQYESLLSSLWLDIHVPQKWKMLWTPSVNWGLIKESVTKRMSPGSYGPTNCRLYRKFDDGDVQDEHIGKRNAGMWSFTAWLQGLRDKVQLSTMWDQRKHYVTTYNVHLEEAVNVWFKDKVNAKMATVEQTFITVSQKVLDRDILIQTLHQQMDQAKATLNTKTLLRVDVIMGGERKYKHLFYCKWKTRRNVQHVFSYQLMILLWLLSGIIHVGADAFVTISPTNDCTALVNNTSTFTFNCSGDGTYLYWTVDGHADSSLYVLNKGISYTLPVSEDGVTISSQLIVPTTKASNNTVVICTVVDVTFKYYQSSDPVKLILLDLIIVLPTTNATAGPRNTHVGYAIAVAGPIAVIGLLLLMTVGVACATYMYRAHEDTVSSVGMKKSISK